MTKQESTTKPALGCWNEVFHHLDRYNLLNKDLGVRAAADYFAQQQSIKTPSQTQRHERGGEMK